MSAKGRGTGVRQLQSASDASILEGSQMTHEAWRSELQDGVQEYRSSGMMRKGTYFRIDGGNFSGATIIESREMSRGWHAELLREHDRGRGGLGLCSPKSSDLGASARRSSGTSDGLRGCEVILVDRFHAGVRGALRQIRDEAGLSAVTSQ